MKKVGELLTQSELLAIDTACSALARLANASPTGQRTVDRVAVTVRCDGRVYMSGMTFDGLAVWHVLPGLPTPGEVLAETWIEVETR
jgi:hypothetical protein